ncbi:YHS domain-containing (seleno)protein [Aliagarivorans taiwanensis]|uniref:YHS domain-containing (seleno)protein n=1 Tax=Aliagarivorans taiwanensis TaxID=561966 RepID=UPI00040B5AF7|nr:YHS domain-containing (seleno)protein [Aliagarivorans taiwanensis]
MKHSPLALLLVLASIFLPGQVMAAKDPIFTPWSSNKAIRGYDPVAYFTQQAAVKGSKQYTLEWQGADWLFSSAENLAAFEAEPERYAPQYGGYCAYALANDELAPIDPEQFTIVDGKLYLNYSAKIQQRWLKNRDEYISDADGHWPTVLER